jgi:hypothetical protein
MSSSSLYQVQRVSLTGAARPRSGMGRRTRGFRAFTPHLRCTSASVSRFRFAGSPAFALARSPAAHLYAPAKIIRKRKPPFATLLNFWSAVFKIRRASPKLLYRKRVHGHIGPAR